MHRHGIHTPVPRQSKRAAYGKSSEQFVDSGRNLQQLNYERFSENEIDLIKTIAEVLSKTYIDSENRNKKDLDIGNNSRIPIP